MPENLVSYIIVQTFERFRLGNGSPDDIVRVRELLALACGGRISVDPDNALKQLWDHDFFGGGRFARFHVVRERQNRIIGMTHSAWFRDGMCLNALSIEPSSRGNGVGKRVVTTLADVATKCGIEQIWLYAKPEPKVLQFYQKLGFAALPPTDYRVDPDTESLLVPLAANPVRILEKPIEPLPLTGTIL